MGRKFTGYFDKNEKKIYQGDVVQWGTVGKFYVFYAPHTNSTWGMVYIEKLHDWDGKTADYFLSVFNDDKSGILRLLEKKARGVS